MGREPQQGTDGKQEQNQPWAESQYYGDGRQAGAGIAMGREPNRGTEGRSRDSHGQRANAGNGRQAGTGQQGQSAYARDGQQQGNRGRVLTHGTDGSRIAGAKCLRTERTARQKGQRAYAGVGRQQGSMGREPTQGSVGNRAAGQRAFAGVGRLKKKSLYIIACGRKNGRCFCKQKNAVFWKAFFFKPAALSCFGTLPSNAALFACRPLFASALCPRMLPCLPSAPFCFGTLPSNAALFAFRPFLLRHSAHAALFAFRPFLLRHSAPSALLSVPFLLTQKCPCHPATVRPLSANAEMPLLPCCCPSPFCLRRNAPVALFLLAFRPHKIGSLPMAVPAPATHPQKIGSLPMAVPAPACHPSP